MKRFRFLTIMLFVMTACVAFTGCSDDDEVSPVEVQKSQLVGTWRDAAFSGGSYHEYTFSADGTFREFFYYGPTGESELEDGKYAVTEDILTLYYYEDGKPESVNAYAYDFIDKNRLRIGSYMFTRQ